MYFILSSFLGFGCLLSLIGVSQSDDNVRLNINPRYLYITEEKPRETLVLCTLEDQYGDAIPLAGCQFQSYYSDHFWDFNNGADTPRNTDGPYLASYHGNGLEKGECGITFANYSSYETLILGCRVRPASGGAWIYEKMILVKTAWKHMQFHLEPPGVTIALPGTDVTFNGKAEQIIDGCYFYLPPAYRPVAVDFEQGRASTNYSLGHYHGAGLERRECGITLPRVTPELTGFVRAHVLTGVTKSSHSFVELIVATAPEAPLLTVAERKRFSSGEVLHAICVVRNSRPIANITWYVGDDVVRQDSINEAPIEYMFRWNHDLQTIKQHLKYVVKSTDDGKKLKCTSSHVTLISGSQNSTLYEIRVYSDVPVPKTTTVSSLPAEPDYCTPNPCGNHSVCYRGGGVVINCSCKKDYNGNPPHCTPQCVTDNNCPAYVKCVDGRCVDSCISKECGLKADCHHERGKAVCGCLEGFVGVPDIRCEKENAPNCGKRTVSPTLEAGVKNAALGEFPWHAGLYAMIDGYYRFVCGGTLIRRNIVVTAAHCVYSESRETIQNATELIVALGKLHKDFNDDLGSNYLQLVKVDSISVPPEYYGLQSNFRDDIAVLRLASHVRITSAVNVACVDWSESARRHREPAWAIVNATGVAGTVAGWTKESNPGDGSIALQLLDLQWTDKNTCYDETSQESLQFITEDKFCATFHGQKNVLCQVVSGAGYMVLTNGTFYLRGVVSVPLTYPDIRVCNTERFGAFQGFARHKAWVQSKFFG